METRKKVFVHLESGRGYSRDILKGIYAHNRFNRWDIIFEPAYFLKNNHTRSDISIIKALKPDGCILEFPQNVSALKRMGIPVVQVTSVHHSSSIPYVKGNYESDGKMAARYFQKKGFQNFAFFGIEGLEWSEARYSSFKFQAEEAGINLYSYFLKGNDADVLTHNFTDLNNWLKKLPKPIAVLCCNDDFGQILINSCSMAAIKVPHEIAILGIDNDELICNITSPNLSSISRNHSKTASSVCSILDEMMNGTRMHRHFISTEAVEVMERASTDTVSTGDSDVAEAITFISSNIRLPITVNDVAAVGNFSVRVLNSRFKKLTGNTIHQEIQFRKLSMFKQLLKQNLSIKEIAFELGFQDISHVSRWFSHLEGTSPLEWKKKYYN